MCGLAFLMDRTTADGHARVAAALDCMRYRGPDAMAMVDGEGFTAGHLRLAIVDLVGGQQPMRDTTGRWTLVFNGEIYNHRDLRTSLADRWSFRDASDTEVLLAGLVLEGQAFIERLDGMWAFVLHDAATGQLLASRDRFGKKPLYYRHGAFGIAFASELPALRRMLPDFAWEESEEDIPDFFRYGYAMPGRTFFADTFEVLPGHWMFRDAAGRLEERRYWHPATEPLTIGFDDAAAEVRRLLEAATTARQLSADVEVGAFLSGGVDSTVVCALAQRNTSLQTFTAGFAERSYDERPWAARAAAEIGTRHIAESLDEREAGVLARELAVRMGQPFGDASLVPSAMVSRVAGRHVKVVLTGDGGDEVFGGYARYSARLVRERYQQLPGMLRAVIERSVLAFDEPMAHHSGSLLKRAHLFVASVREPRGNYVAPPAIRAATLAQLVPAIGGGRGMPEGPWLTQGDDVRQMMLNDWLVWMPQDILAKVDRATMAFSVEARSPFLDRALVEFVLRLPVAWHFAGFKGKRLLRAAMSGHAPSFIWSRRKQGFASPVSHWMRGAMGDELLALAASVHAPRLDRAMLERLVAEHRRGGTDHAQPLWLAYTYLLWRESLQG